MDDLLAYGILTVGGIITTYIGWAKLNQAGEKSDDMEEEEGIVFDIERTLMRGSTDNNMSKSDKLIIRFVTKDMQWITEKLEDGYIPGTFKKGEKLKIRYNKNNPTDFIIISSKLNAYYIVTLALGMCMLIGGLYLLISTLFL